MKSFEQVPATKWRPTEATGPVGLLKIEPSQLEKRYGLKFVEDSDDLDSMKVAVIETKSGHRFGLIRYARSPEPGTQVYGDTAAEEPKASRAEFMDALKLDLGDFAWTPRQVNGQHRVEAMNAAITKVQLLKIVSARTGMARKEVEQVYEHTVRTIQEAVKRGEKVALTGFGRFTQRVQAARKASMGKNPFTGETIKFGARPERKLPRFAPAKQFKEYVSGSMRLPALPASKASSKASLRKASHKTDHRTAAAARKSAARKTAAKRSRQRTASQKRGRTAAKSVGSRKR